MPADGFNSPPRVPGEGYNRPARDREEDYGRPPRMPTGGYNSRPRVPGEGYNRPARDREEDYGRPPRMPTGGYNTPPRPSQDDRNRVSWGREEDFSRPVRTARADRVDAPRNSKPRPAEKHASTSLWAGPVILITALGVLGQAWISYEGRTTGSSSSVFFYLTLSLIYAPNAALILSRKVTDSAKVWFTLYMSLALLATRYLQYPTQFAYHDELVHQAIATSIDQTGHLFHPANSILPEASDYPGMEILTTGIQHMTGLSLHSAAWLMLIMAHIIGTLAFVELIRRISGSATVACIAAFIYNCNEEQIFFNAAFSYASLALPVAMLCIYVFVRGSRSASIAGLMPATAVLAALTVTHHLTALAVVVLLCAWWLAAQIRHRGSRELSTFLAVSVLVVGAWTWFARRYIVTYIGQAVLGVLKSIEQQVTGSSSHQLFSTSSGYKSPHWEIYVTTGSVLLIVAMLIPALIYVIRRWRFVGPAAILLVGMAIAYPAIPAGHLSNNSSEVADRSASFLFCGLAYVISMWWCRQVTVPRRIDTSSASATRSPSFSPGSQIQDSRRLRPRALFALGLTFCFVGGGIIGGADWSYVPGSYMVIADNRSIDQLTLAAGYWESANIKPGSYSLSDRDNGLIAQSYGGLHDVTAAADGIDEGALTNLLLRFPAPSDITTACADKVQYLISDDRLATALPEMGLYIDEGEYLFPLGARKAPPPIGDLIKFDQVPGAERIYDNSAIRIFNLEGLKCPG